MTLEQLDAERAHHREYERERRAKMTPELRRREDERKRRAARTPEQLDARRAYNREYARKRRWKARAAKATLEN